MILSDEQIADAITDNTEATPVGYVVFITSRDRKIAKAQDAQTRQDTLREVAKIMRALENWGQLNVRDFPLVTALVESCERGEMPKQSGT